MDHDHVLIKIPGVPVSKLGPMLWVQTHTEQREVWGATDVPYQQVYSKCRDSYRQAGRNLEGS